MSKSGFNSLKALRKIKNDTLCQPISNAALTDRQLTVIPVNNIPF